MKEFVAKTFHGLEPILAQEIQNIGGQDVQILKRAVKFYGDKRLLYSANYNLRTALKILVPIKEFTIYSQTDFYYKIKKIKWQEYISADSTIQIETVCNSKFFKNTHFVTLRTKDAIVDKFRELTGKRPGIDTLHPDLKINVHISDAKCTISLDSSGDPLFKRGYRTKTGDAPLNEVLAAGLIKMSGWNGNCDFYDPMCGSGTLAIEAALIAYNIPPGLYRKEFAFEKWADFDEDLFEIVCDEENPKDFNFNIYASDISEKTARIAEENINSASLKGKIKVFRKPFEDFSVPETPGMIITNPPYGERLSKDDDMIQFYAEIGNKLKKDFPDFDAWIISSNLKALKHVGLKPSKKIPLFNGALECRFNKFEMYKGSKKINSDA